MTELQIEKARWIEKYDNLAERINMPEYKWASGNLETIKKRYTILYIHSTQIKHIDKPVQWIIKEEKKEEISFKDYIQQVKNICGQKINLDMDEVAAGYENDIPVKELAKRINFLV